MAKNKTSWDSKLGVKEILLFVGVFIVVLVVIFAIGNKPEPLVNLAELSNITYDSAPNYLGSLTNKEWNDYDKLWNIEYDVDGFRYFSCSYDEKGNLWSIMGQFETNPKDNKKLVKLIGVDEYVDSDKSFVLYDVAGFKIINGAATMQTGFFSARKYTDEELEQRWD